MLKIIGYACYVNPDVAALNSPVNGLLVYTKPLTVSGIISPMPGNPYNKRFDSIFATYANIKTLVSSHASFDTLQVGGVDIHNLITNIVDSSYWRLKGNTNINHSVYLIYLKKQQ
jgi:hypothetical protein